MIDREQVSKFLDVLDFLSEEAASIEIYQDGKIKMTVYPKEWWMDVPWSTDKRHAMLALITPLIGKLEKKVVGRNIGYQGQKENLEVCLNYIDKCTILGYKTITKTVLKEVERPVEYEEVEERIAITDCDVRQGKFSKEDIEVEA